MSLRLIHDRSGPLAPATRAALSAAADAIRTVAATEAALEAAIDAVTLAPRAVDRLECHAATTKTEGGFFRPVVIVMFGDAPVLMSADTARRIAVRQEGKGREGAAHDLLACADLSETISAQLQGAIH